VNPSAPFLMSLSFRSFVRQLALLIGFSVATAALGAETPSATQPDNRLLLIHDGAKVAQPLVEFLESRGGFQITQVDQAHLPADWTGFRAVLGYVHNKLLEPTELALIDYTKKGGRFLALHHMISSGKAANKYYFDFLGIQLDSPKTAREAVLPGVGYGWFTGGPGDPGVTVALVNLHPSHYIVSHDVKWNDVIRYQSSDRLAAEKEYPAIILRKAEAYMNHKFTDGREKTVLCGMKYTDPRNEAVFEQDRMVWFKSYGAGRIFYFQPGHFSEEYQNPNIAQMILNAIVWDGR
jgi:hypothetical protein